MSESDVPVGGWMSRRIWEVHSDGCTCPHCAFTDAHLDDDDDTEGDPWT